MKGNTYMKKLLIIGAATLLVLTGCNKSSGGSFDEKLSYEEEMSEVETVTLLGNIKKELSNLNKMELSYESKENADHYEMHVTAKGTITLYSDNYILTEGTTTNEETNDGLTVKKTVKTKVETGEHSSGKAIVTYRVLDDEVTYNVQKYTDETKDAVLENLYTSNYSDYLSILNNHTAYKGKDGYAFITSTYNKQVTAVEWGYGTKERINIQKNQFVCKIDKNYHIKSYYSYAEQITNRDPNSGEWYKKETTVLKNSQTIKFAYGNRASAGNKKSALTSKFDSAYFQNVIFSVPGTLNTTTPLPVDVEYEEKVVAVNRIHIVAIANLNFAPFGTLELDPTLEVTFRSNVSAENPTNETKKISFFTDDPLLKNENNKLKVDYSKFMKIVFDFDVAISGSSVEILNGKAYTL